MELLVFYNANAGSRVIFYFQGCYMFPNMAILLNYGNPELKNMSFPQFIHKIQNRVVFVTILSKKPKYFLELNVPAILCFYKLKYWVS